MNHKIKLDQLVLDIEFLLISVIQGVALAALAGIASPLIVTLQIESWPYVVSAFLFVLIFWSHAIIHAISFIDWPLDLSHSFLYFLVSFFEVIAFSQMTHPLGWFGILIVSFIIIEVLYFVDLKLIKNHREDFSKTKEKLMLYDHIESQHLYEFRVIFPIGLIYNLVAFLLIWKLPTFFLFQKGHVILASIQVILIFSTLVHALNSFKVRKQLISKAI